MLNAVAASERVSVTRLMWIPMADSSWRMTGAAVSYSAPP
jgi:hypothetical protein